MKTGSSFSPPEIAGIINSTPKHVRDEIRDGRIPGSYKIGRLHHVPFKDGKAYICRVLFGGKTPFAAA